MRGIILKSGPQKQPRTLFATSWRTRIACAGHFKDYHLQGQGGDPPADYTGRVFKLSQDYPNQLPPMEDYPVAQNRVQGRRPCRSEGLSSGFLDYGLAGNVDVDFYVEDNKVRKWYGMPWMDWNTEVASDWPGTDGREFVHGLTHEFNSIRQDAQHASE